MDFWAPSPPELSDSVSVRWYLGIRLTSSTKDNLSKGKDLPHYPTPTPLHHTASFVKDDMPVSESQHRGSLSQIAKLCNKELGDFSINHTVKSHASWDDHHEWKQKHFLLLSFVLQLSGSDVTLSLIVLQCIQNLYHAF